MTLVLSEFFRYLPRRWIDIDREPRHADFKNVYLRALGRGELHAATPVVEFIHSAVQQSRCVRKASVRAGLFDLLLSLCSGDFGLDFAPKASKVKEDREMGRAVLHAACTSVLQHVLSDGEEMHALWTEHPASVLWPQPNTVLHTSAQPALDDRCAAWRDVRTGEHCVVARIEVIDGVLCELPRESELVLYACIDLVEFARYDSYGAKIEEWALSYLLRCIAKGGELWHYLIHALASVPRDHATEVLTRVINSLLPFTTHKSTVLSLQIYLDTISLHRDADVDPLNNFIEFAIAAASHSHSRSMQIALLDGGIVSLLLPLLEDELRDPAQFPAAFFPPDDASGDSADSDATLCDTLRLLRAVRKVGLAPLLRDEAEAPPENVERRELCCRAFEALLSGPERNDEEYRVLLRETLGWTMEDEVLDV